MRNHLNLLREFSVPLILGVVTALFWGNLDPEGYRHFNYDPVLGPFSFHFLTNDIFMALFFGIAAVEISQSCLPGGDLHPLKTAINPLLATLGGVLGPILCYLGLNAMLGAPELSRGWGIPTATDIAFAWLVARLVFGAGHPAISFLLLLAIADDAIGLIIIALFYTDPTTPVHPAWLLLTGLGMSAAYILRRYGMKNYWPYLIAGGIPSWIGLHEAHLHPALALVFIIPFLPSRPKEEMHIFEQDPVDKSPLARFEHEWKVTVDFGLFMFGLVNAGVSLAAMGTATWLVLASLIVGKTAGISILALLAVRLGYPLPENMTAKDLFVAAMISGIGFTVALFVANEAFTDPAIQGAAKMGAMLSCLAAPLAFAASRLLGAAKAK
ncbi:MAG: Na+/H+ antiporter NhaA [Geobacter sp.]|nr:Na+/H+ antiporter NhaA [Geobacter sp.]